MARYGGIDLGGTKIQAVVVDDAHQVLGAARHPTPTTGGPADVALAMVGAMREALTTGEVTLDELTAVGLLCEHLRPTLESDVVVVSSDIGFAKRARSFAELLDAPLAIIEKRRSGNDGSSEATLPMALPMNAGWCRIGRFFPITANAVRITSFIDITSGPPSSKS